MENKETAFMDALKEASVYLDQMTREEYTTMMLSESRNRVLKRMFEKYRVRVLGMNKEDWNDIANGRDDGR